MQEKGIQTTPGCTTVEYNGEVHEFIADDDAHPRKMEIYDKLNEINRHLRIAGYVPNVSSELHDLDSEGKESALTYHSEKLAIAFALLVMPQHTPIRLEKNLCVRSIGRGYITTRFPEKILKINLLLCIGRFCFQFPTEYQVISRQTHISHTKC